MPSSPRTSVLVAAPSAARAAGGATAAAAKRASPRPRRLSSSVRGRLHGRVRHLLGSNWLPPASSPTPDTPRSAPAQHQRRRRQLVVFPLLQRRLVLPAATASQTALPHYAGGRYGFAPRPGRPPRRFSSRDRLHRSPRTGFRRRAREVASSSRLHAFISSRRSIARSGSRALCPPSQPNGGKGLILVFLIGERPAGRGRMARFSFQGPAAGLRPKQAVRPLRREIAEPAGPHIHAGDAGAPACSQSHQASS